MRVKRKPLFVFLILTFPLKGDAQEPEIPAYNASQLESLAERKDADPQDDSFELDLETYHKHPLNLNAASAEDLNQLHLLQTLQVNNFLTYRKLLGPLLTVHELQAIPGWDIETIRKLLPYIMIGRDESLYSAVRERWRGGDESLLMRTGQVLEKSKGFKKPLNPDASYYEGSAQKIFIRYMYNYKNLLSFGFTGEKDAGEPFFRGAQRYGFDFYSFHFFLQHTGVVSALAIGDFTVNMGQGLIQWQTIAFTKSSQAMAVKREASCIKPYHSAGEFNFHRGIGISLQKGRWQGSFFISSQKISTNLEPDTVGREDLFSSFQNSGYHRTPVEIADRNNSQQFSAGANIQYAGDHFMAGFNSMHFHFSRPFKKREAPYNLFSLTGSGLTDYSVDYNYTRGNMHLFGEFATDQWLHVAMIQGVLISMRENLDMSFLYRNISPAYQSLYSDAFTESSFPNNEKGFFTGLAYRPVSGLQADLYYDVFVFPWLKYRVDAPSGGRDFLVSLLYQPNKFWRLTTLYKNERKDGNAASAEARTHGMVSPVKQRWRIETDCTVSRLHSFTGRMEFVSISLPGSRTQQGFLGLAGFNFHGSRFSGNIAVTVFETDGYDTRVYLYEPDLLYNFSLPAYYGKGIHYYINLHKDISHMIQHASRQVRLSVWLKWGQTFFPGYESIGTGLDQIAGSRKSELKLQILLQWK